MKVNIFISAVSAIFFKLIYNGATMVVHLLLLKFSIVYQKIILCMQHPSSCWRNKAKMFVSSFCGVVLVATIFVVHKTIRPKLLMNEKDKAKETTTTQTQDTTTKEKKYPCQGCKEFKVNNLWV